VSEQRIAVAVHQQQALPAGGCGGKRVDDGLRRRGCVVPDPELEQVTEDDQLAVPRRVLAQELEEACSRAWPLRGEVQVGDEERIGQRRRRRRDGEHRRRFGQAHSRISARSSSTSDSGTSWCIPGGRCGRP